MSDIRVNVSIQNLAPDNGTSLTPLWVGFHNGGFDLYDQQEPASPGLERLAEDGNAAVLAQEFVQSEAGVVEGVVGGGPIAPGTAVHRSFTLDSTQATSRYFSYASMILPSNDFFVANGNPREHVLFSEGGEGENGDFVGDTFFIVGNEVLDAGTEVNDELPESTAFFGQSAPNTGAVEGVVRAASGFIPVANEGRILADERFTDADFTAPGYEVARIQFIDAGEGQVTVRLTNLAPEAGTRLTSLWVGFHDGSFDTYNRGEAVTEGLERLAEDGTTSVLSGEFSDAFNGNTRTIGDETLEREKVAIAERVAITDSNVVAIDGTVGETPIQPGTVVERTFDLSELAGAQYFSYASMILPSNDFFISNGNPLAHRILDENGAFVATDITITGDRVLDAGTEVNDEVAANTAFFGQSAPNTGQSEGVVRLAEGFIPNGRILTAEQFAAADFTQRGYRVARVQIREIGEASADANNVIGIQGPGSALQLSIAENNTDEANEIIAVFTESEDGSINGIAPGEAGYEAAFLENAQTVLTALQGDDLAGFNPTKTLDVSDGQFIQLGLVQAGSLSSLQNGGDGELLLGTPVGNSDSRSALNIEKTADGELQFNFRAPDGGGAGEFDDLVLNAQLSFARQPVGTALQNSDGLEVLDLRNEAGAVLAEFSVFREAQFNNQVGFYRIENEQGAVLAPDGTTLLVPGDEGYQAAALARRLADVLLGGNNGEVVTSDAQLSAGQLLAPFLITEGEIGQLLDADFDNDPNIYFAYQGANSDGADHVRLLGDNTFGFEDLSGGGDRDFNDIVVSAKLTATEFD